MFFQKILSKGFLGKWYCHLPTYSYCSSTIPLGNRTYSINILEIYCFQGPISIFKMTQNFLVELLWQILNTINAFFKADSLNNSNTRWIKVDTHPVEWVENLLHFRLSNCNALRAFGRAKIHFKKKLGRTISQRDYLRRSGKVLFLDWLLCPLIFCILQQYDLTPSGYYTSLQFKSKSELAWGWIKGFESSDDLQNLARTLTRQLSKVKLTFEASNETNWPSKNRASG